MAPRLILFGAFDRHNFGDVLLAHCARRAHPDREAVFAGLVTRDLRRHGGQRVRALGEAIRAHGDEPADFVHVGGEILTTTAWEAAVMLQTPAEATRAIARYGRDPEDGRVWAKGVLRCAREAPYVIGAGELPPAWRVHFTAAGGVALDEVAASMREEVVAALGSATSVSVRDARTHASLARAGISAKLVRDPAAATAQWFGDWIGRRARSGEPVALGRRFPNGWIAVQLAAQWGDDETLDRVGAEARAHAGARDCGVVLFRAGIAPWHDEAAVLERLAARLAGVPFALLRSIHVFDICAVLAGAQAYLGSSLHGWIVADSFGVPGICLVSGPEAKAAAYLQTWASGGDGSSRDPVERGNGEANAARAEASSAGDGAARRPWRTPEELGR